MTVARELVVTFDIEKLPLWRLRVASVARLLCVDSLLRWALRPAILVERGAAVRPAVDG